jgi:uncharacterized FlaG/YvyC family protein
MSVNTGELPPVASGPWVAAEFYQKEVQSVSPIARGEGGTAARADADKANCGNNLPLLDEEFSAEVAQQVQTFLQENLGIELNFVVGADGRTVVQVLDSNSGKVIRKIPPEKVPRFRDKMEKLRGILFDGKA